jgi:hypothetical protein
MAFLALATAVRDQFGQGNRFVDDLLRLAQNYDDYNAEVLSRRLTR